MSPHHVSSARAFVVRLACAAVVGFSVPVRSAAQNQLIVGPKGEATVVFPNTSGSVGFSLTGLTQGQSYGWSWSCSGAVTSCTSAPGNPPNPFTATAYGQDVTINFSVGYPWTGSVSLSAQGGGGSDAGSWNVTLNNNGPVVSTRPTNGDYRDVSKCVANCFDGVASYSTVPHYSADVPRSVHLSYRSAQAHPMGIVQVDAVDTSNISPVKMSIQLYTPQGTRVTFTNGSTEIFYNWAAHPADGNVNRLAAEFDASSLATGAYDYLVVVRSYRSDGSFRETDMLPVRILIANEVNSPFGAGWSIAGFQRLYPQANGSIVVTEGNGSVAYFARGATNCQLFLFGYPYCETTYTSPSDFTSLVRDSSESQNLTFPVPYSRTYPDGTGLGFLPDGRIYNTRDPFGNSTSFKYNGSNLLVAITDPALKDDSLGYSANKLLWMKDPGGRVDSITIDGSGNLTRVKDWAKIVAHGGPSATFQYDGNHRLVHWTDRRGGAWGLGYDFAGKVAADSNPQVTANGQNVRPVIRYASAEQRVLIDPASGQGSSSNPGSNVDTAVVRATVTNARGYATTYALNRFGAPTLIQEPLGRTTTLTRDSNSAVVLYVSPSGHMTKYAWIGPNLLVYKDSTTGRDIDFTYIGNRVNTVSGDVDSVVNHWTGARLDSTHSGGSGWTKFTPGADGRICGVTDPGGHTRTCYYSSASGFRNTDSISYTLGTVRYGYDGHGQRVMVIDQVKDTTRTVYDSIGRVLKTVGGLHDTTFFYYDDSLYLTRVTDTKGQVYKYWPNALGWVDSTTDPAGKVDHYQYDLNGNRTSWTNRNGRTITYTYDALDRPSSVGADGKTTTLAYDPAGHYQVTSNSESTDTLRIDAADRPWVAISCRVLVSGNAPQCFRDSSVYEIRDVDTLAVLTAPSLWGSTQFLVGHHYDVHQLLDTLTPGHLDTQTGQPIRFVYSAEALDSVQTFTGLNNLTLTHSYPWTHRTDQVQLSDPTLTAVLGTAYNFDNAGRLQTRYHGSLSNPDTTRSFVYDRQGNLSQYADSGHQLVTQCTFYGCGYRCTDVDQPWLIGSTSYVYDSVANRKDPTAPNGGLDPANRLRRWQSFRMDYDAAGNLTAKRTLSTSDTTKVLRTDSLFWSALGGLDSVRTRDSTGTLTGRVTFGYDGWGRRVRKSTATGTRRYLWDGDALLAELDTLGNGVAGYTYSPGTDNVASVLRHDRGDSTYYYIQDYSRNVLALLALTSGGVTIDNQYRYEPFGNTQGSTTSTIPNTLQFAGREHDAETQLYYDRARYIDPAVGRFVSEDPIGLDGGINLYAFVGNDPVNGWDPSGTSCKDFSFSQEKVSDKLAHYEFGEVLVKLSWYYNWPRWRATEFAALLGLIHEGPWGNIGSPFRPLHGWLGDHDLWGWKHGAKGAPCAGFVDTFFFMLAPLIYDISAGYDPGFGTVQTPSYPGWDPRHVGIPFTFPNILPPTIPQGLRPGGWGGWGPTL